MRATFRAWLQEFAAQYGEPEAFVVGSESSWGRHGLGSWADLAPEKRNVVITSMDDALLDKPFNNGYGSPGCPAMYAWSESHVFFIGSYDGATSWYAVPRHPQDCRPNMSGGG